MEFKDYYKTLGVKEDAPAADIKRAYRKLARKYHPDVSSEKDAESRFKEINEAYEVLGKADKREAYDDMRRNPRGPEFATQGADGRQRYEFHSGGGAGDDRFSDFFRTFFGGGGQDSMGGFDNTGGFDQFRDWGAALDVHQRLAITLEETFAGSKCELQVPKSSGGYQTLKVSIPAGISDGQQIRLKGKGSTDPRSGKTGDLFLQVNIAPHPLFVTDGKDVYVTVPIAPWEAALGASIGVPTLKGEVSLKVPPGSQAGRKLRLKGRGLPGTPEGDQYVVLSIVIPPADTEDTRKAWQALAAQSNVDPRAELKRKAGPAWRGAA